MKTLTYDCVVIGTGAAGYNAACRAKSLGVDVCIVTEGVNVGTSRNTGSDKQTYYKLGLGGSEADSVLLMAKNLFDGGCVDGDNALCEAALSVRCFMNLCELGVEFPTNRYGEYVGYKTDHDPYARATSAGPLTSKMMTEALQRKAEELKIPVFDGFRAVKILKNRDAVCGLLCVKDEEYFAFRCRDIIMATGGPAGIYADSVYPECHRGSSGLAVMAGAKMQNMSLWQYGLASVKPRWNVSGTYMQVLPRLVSVDAAGVEHDFLLEYFEDKYHGLSLLFLKGYQWPFDPQKAEKGSSLIDMLVYSERVEKNRRVYLDYTKNPFDIDFTKLSAEAYSYLEKAGALFGTPIERLSKMNLPAIELYLSKGVDLSKEYLEIALCAQHNNGGVAVDAWWQSSVMGLYAVGECAGTHGISRPGGSALNAGQVGSLRAAQYIAQNPGKLVADGEFEELISVYTKPGELERKDAVISAQKRMSAHAAAVRDPEKMKEILAITLEELKTAESFELADLLITQGAVLCAMLNPVTDKSKVCEVLWNGDRFDVTERHVRPIPTEDNFFENVWRGYRENKNIF